MDRSRTANLRTQALPTARVEKTRTAWLLWLVPLAALGLCVWFVYRDFVAVGPMITISFQSAEGLEEGNTQLKYRGTQIGAVKTLRLTGDNSHVEVQVRLTGSARQIARAGSVFWIVRPEVKLGGISGLRTIISGEYIAVEPGNGPKTTHFVGVEQAPLPREPKALRLTLLAPNLSSLKEQTPVLYRGLQVGEVTECQLGSDAQEITIQVRIREAYAPLVRVNSKFWNAGRLSIKLGLFHGAEISAESPESLLSGGIEFATPTNLGEPATNDATFRLYDKPDDEWRTWRPLINLHLPPPPRDPDGGDPNRAPARPQP